MIFKAHLAASLVPPDEVVMLEMIGAWAEVLEDIPTDWLEEFYRTAAKSKANGFAVNALDIIAAYNAAPPERTKPYPPMEHTFERDERGCWKSLYKRDPKTALYAYGFEKQADAERMHEHIRAVLGQMWQRGEIDGETDVTAIAQDIIAQAKGRGRR